MRPFVKILWPLVWLLWMYLVANNSATDCLQRFVSNGSVVYLVGHEIMHTLCYFLLVTLVLCVQLCTCHCVRFKFLHEAAFFCFLLLDLSAEIVWQSRALAQGEKGIISLFIRCVGIFWNNSVVGGRAQTEVWVPAREHITLYCTLCPSALPTGLHGQVDTKLHVIRNSIHQTVRSAGVAKVVYETSIVWCHFDSVLCTI